MSNIAYLLGTMMETDKVAQIILTAWQPLSDAGAFRIERDGRDTSLAEEHQADLSLEVGSCFKAVIAAECCRQAERGMLNWREPLQLSADVRVPHSHAFESLPVGASVTVREAAEAMIAVSDNTATDLLLRRVGDESVRALVAEIGMASTRLPTSLRDLYALATVPPESAAPRIEACISTARDLTRFYRHELQGKLFAHPASLDAFKTLLRQEDLHQGTQWPAGVVCYRKGGSLEPPPLLAVALAGAFEAGERSAFFAFACNVEIEDRAAGAAMVDAFSAGVSAALKAVAAAETHDCPSEAADA